MYVYIYTKIYFLTLSFQTAIAVSLSLRTRLTLVSSDNDKVILELKDLGLSKEWNLNELNDCVLSCAGMFIFISEICHFFSLLF